MKYGRLKILKEAGRKGHHTRVEAECECGVVRIFNLDSLESGATKSCGCLRREVTAQRNKSHKPGLSHGMSESGEYSSYHHMLDRCKNNPAYKNRGVAVCKRWQGKNGFLKFIKDMGARPGEKYSIDRIDNNGDYTPENCRWATKKQQQNNTRNNLRITSGGVTKTLSEWAEITGTNSETIRARLKKLGWSAERAIWG